MKLVSLDWVHLHRRCFSAENLVSRYISDTKQLFIDLSVAEAVEKYNKRKFLKSEFVFDLETSKMVHAEAEDIFPSYSIFFGGLAAVFAIVLSSMGAAYGTAVSGLGISSMAIAKPELIMKSIIPVVMAGIIAIYGLVVGVLIAGSLDINYTIQRSYIQMGAGLSVGLSGLAAGYAIGVVGDAGVRATPQQPHLFVGMILVLIFAEVLGLYGLIVAIYLYTK